MRKIKDALEATLITSIDGKMAKNSAISIQDNYLLRERRENRISDDNYILRELKLGDFRSKVSKQVYAVNNNIDTQIFKQEANMAKLEQKRTNRKLEVKSKEQVQDEIQEHSTKVSYLLDFRKLANKVFNNVTVKSYKNRVTLYLNQKELMSFYSEPGIKQFTPHESLGWVSPSDSIQEEFKLD